MELCLLNELDVTIAVLFVFAAALLLTLVIAWVIWRIC